MIAAAAVTLRCGSYVAAYPVFVVVDHPQQLRFSMQVDDLHAAQSEPWGSLAVAEDVAEPRRAWSRRLVKASARPPCARLRTGVGAGFCIGDSTIERHDFDTGTLMAQHPPVWGHPNKQVIFDIACRPA